MLLRHLRSKLDSREGFVKCVEWAAKQTCLLTRDDRDGLRIGELARRLARGNRGATAFELSGDNRAELCPWPGILLRLRDRSGPGWRRGRVAGKKRSERRKLKCVIGSEFPDAGQAPNVDRNVQRIYVTIRPLSREDSILYFPPEAFGPFR